MTVIGVSQDTHGQAVAICAWFMTDNNDVREHRFPPAALESRDSAVG